MWSGHRALQNGLVDGIGGVDRAISIAKQAAGIGVHLLPSGAQVFPPRVVAFKHSPLGHCISYKWETSCGTAAAPHERAAHKSRRAAVSKGLAVDLDICCSRLKEETCTQNWIASC